MDEATWQQTTDVRAMLEYLWTGGGRFACVDEPSLDRRLRLFACACVRSVWRLLTDERSRRAVDVAEGFAEGEATEGERERAWDAAWLVVSSAADAMQTSTLLAARQAAWCAAPTAQAAVDGIREYPATQGGVSPAAAASLLRCVAGSPWRPVVLASTGQPCPRCYGKGTRKGKQGRRKRCRYCLGTGKAHPWLTYQGGLVPKLARGCYDRANRGQGGLLDRGYVLTLADALEEAGLSEEACPYCKDADFSLSDLGGPIMGGKEPYASRAKDYWRSKCACGGHGRVTHPILEHLRTQETVCGLCGGDGRPNSGDDWERRNGDCPACAGAGRWPAVHAVGCWAIDCILGRS